MCETTPKKKAVAAATATAGYIVPAGVYIFQS